MERNYPSEATRERMLKAIGLGILLPGGGHLVAGKTSWAIFWFLLCQGLLFGGMSLAGFTQLDYGRWIQPGGIPLIYTLLPELGNFSGTWVAALFFRSAESGGFSPDLIPFRHLGHLMSAMSGILAVFSCAHAASLTMEKAQPTRKFKVNPGLAALATLALPGLGHWLTGRKGKAVLFFVAIFGLFAIGLALGDFIDFDRQRHPYYWIGQMLVGLPAWLLYLPLEPLQADGHTAFLDVGVMFTTCAGLFNIIASLDAYHRAEADALNEESSP